MRARFMAASGLLVGALALGVTACGDDDDEATTGGGGGDSAKSVVVYSSLPLQGASRPQTTAMVNGIKLALKKAGGKAGDTTVTYQSLDDSTAQAGSWTPEAESANARKTAQDEKSIAYIGAFNSGASAVSIPILNEAGVPQVSPANTYDGLTKSTPATEKGEPEKYYPTGKRTYSRIVPADKIQGEALVSIMKEDGCTNAFVANDKETYGAGLARNVKLAAEGAGFEILGNEGIDPKAPNFRSLADKIKGEGADCFVFSGITANGAVQLFKDIHAALPQAKLYGPDGVCEKGFTDPKEGGIPAEVAELFKCTVATLDLKSYPKGEQFATDFEAEYGEDNPDPYAIYGYEAMDLVLDAIKRAGEGGEVSRETVLTALFDTKDRDSVLGTYSIDKDGDTTLTDYGIYAVDNGELKFDSVVKSSS